MISVEQAQTFILQRARPIAVTEQVALIDCLGRVVAKEVISTIDVPQFDNSSMDGYALRSEDLAADPSTTLTIVDRIAAGGQGVAIGAGEAARIFTGAPIPPGADCVVMQEDCVVADGRLQLLEMVKTAQHIRPRGNNIRRGDTVLTAGTRLRPQEMGLAAAVGGGGDRRGTASKGGGVLQR